MRKTIVRTRGGRVLRITAELDNHFSVTAELWDTERRFRAHREPDAGGCMHAEVLEFAPELAPLVLVHLATPDGVPMHAVANGWYFYSGAARRYEESRSIGYANPEGLTDRERGARALQIPASDLPEGIATRDDFAAFAETLRPRWLRRAAAARALLESL